MFCTVWKEVKQAWQCDVQKINWSYCREHALMRNSTLPQSSQELVGFICHFQNNFVKFSWDHISDSQHTTLQTVAMTRRGSPHGSPSGSVSGCRGVRCPSSCTELWACPLLTWVFCFQNSAKQIEFRFFFFSRDLRLLGSNIAATRRPRQASSGHHSTGPWARGKHPLCGFSLLTNIKDLASDFGHFCYPLFECHFVVV